MIPWGFPEQVWRSRPKRAAFVLTAFILLATIVAPPPVPTQNGPVRGVIEAKAVPLDPRDAGRRRIGALDYLGGWMLTSNTPRFGAISAIHVEGGQIIALTDAGALLRFAIPMRAGRADVLIVPLPSAQGRPGPKSSRDTESLHVEGPSLWVGFERHNAIRRYRRSDLSPGGEARPSPMRRWRANAGAEAMVRLADGRFIVFAEGPSDGRSTSEAVLFEGDPANPATRSHSVRYHRVPGYRITDAALLPDGRLLLLNRRYALFEGISAIVTVADVSRLGPGGTIEGREIAALRPPLTVDNMEALSVTVENGRTIVWIASDDNFFPLQQTLLLKFALVE